MCNNECHFYLRNSVLQITAPRIPNDRFSNFPISPSESGSYGLPIGGGS